MNFKECLNEGIKAYDIKDAGYTSFKSVSDDIKKFEDKTSKLLR